MKYEVPESAHHIAVEVIERLTRHWYRDLPTNLIGSAEAQLRFHNDLVDAFAKHWDLAVNSGIEFERTRLLKILEDKQTEFANASMQHQMKGESEEVRCYLDYYTVLENLIKSIKE